MGESKIYRVVGIDRDHAWWASVDPDEFQRSVWSARSLEIHEGPVPPGILDPSDAQRSGTQPCYSVRIKQSLLDLVTCDGKIAGTGTENTVSLRDYRTWWAYPSMGVAVPLAVAFDAVTFPVQLFVYMQWNGERTRW